jgi:hypothetical protein
MDELKKIILKLKENGCSGIKVSFEDEGALFNEIVTMRNLTSSIGLKLSLKIGGCEAKRDIIDCIDLCADTIVSPMIESSFALEKFVKSLETYNYKNKKAFNLETIKGYENFNEIEKSLDKVDSIVFGRVDFVSSLNKDRNHVNSDEIKDILFDVFTKAKKQNINCCLGGSISIDSKKIIKDLIYSNLLDYFETRYVIFDTKAINFENFDKILELAMLFELEWLRFINNKYTLYANKDLKRIKMMEDRISKI